MKISVIITAFNVEKYIKRAIESFLDQIHENKELIIIDDISTDKTHEIIKFYQEKFPEYIKWIKEKDRGISHARNIALKHVTGDLVGFLGADDFLHKDFFKEMQYYLEMNPNFDVIYFNNYSIGRGRNSFDASALVPISKRNLIKKCPIGSGESFYYRREIFNKFWFNEQNKYCMDYELNMALVTAKYSFYPVNITAVFNVNTGENISSANALKQRLETINVQLKYAGCFMEKLTSCASLIVTLSLSKGV